MLAIDQQAAPNGSGTPIVDLVINDMMVRKEFGTIKYGEPLKAHNGRDMLLDAYQEALDLCIYLRGEIENRYDPR